MIYIGHNVILPFFYFFTVQRGLIFGNWSPFDHIHLILKNNAAVTILTKKDRT